MATTYADLATLRTLPGIPASGDDTLLQLLLDTAADWIDGYCGTKFVTQTATNEDYSGDGSYTLWLRSRPVISVTSVTVDESAVDSDEYELVDYNRLVIPEGNVYNARLRSYQGAWSKGTNNIQVSYTWGYAAVPNQIKLACCRLAAYWYRQQGDDGVTSRRLGPLQATYDPSRVPSQILALLDSYKVHWVDG